MADPVAVSRAWGLEVLLDATDRSLPDLPSAPQWVRTYLPVLGRLWGDGLTKVHRPGLNEEILAWARSDPHSLLDAARYLADHGEPGNHPAAQRLFGQLTSGPNAKSVETRQFFLDRLLKARPQGLVEAVQILLAHPYEVIRVMTHYGYTDPQTIGGYLDRDLPGSRQTGSAATVRRGPPHPDVGNGSARVSRHRRRRGSVSHREAGISSRMTAAVGWLCSRWPRRCAMNRIAARPAAT